MRGKSEAAIGVPLFWEYSLSRYAHDEVKDSCLSLQDKFDYNVNLLLFCMLCDSLETVLSKSEITTIRNDILPSEHGLTKHREKRRLKKLEIDPSTPQKNKDEYQALLREELKLEVAQQECIVASYLKLNKAKTLMDRGAIDASNQASPKSSSLEYYLGIMASGDNEIVRPVLKEQRERQEQLIRVLGKYV